MKIEQFRVENYRNIIDSGFVKVTDITSIVGQNECGKSNLLNALYKFSPFDNSQYNIDIDWPIDKWPERKSGKTSTVCQVLFTLSAEEVAALYEVARPEEEDDESEEPSTKEPSVYPPASITVCKTYENSYRVTVPTAIYENLDQAKVHKWITSRIPKCVYMDDYLTFTGHHPNIADLANRHNSKQAVTKEEETILIAIDVAALDIDDLVAKGNTEDGKRQRAYDTNAAQTYLSRQFSDKWNQKDVEFEIRVDANRLEIFVKDAGLGSFVPLEARSRGLQWYISFVWRFTHASQGEYEDCILLLDEPGIHLHHAAHEDLLKFFEVLSETNTVIYTTHLATLLDEGYPERIRIMEVDKHHASLLNGMVSKQKIPMMVVEARLGLTGSMSRLLGNRQTLIVEGGTDAAILQKLSRVLKNSGEEGLSERIYPWPAEGAPKTPMFAGFLVGQGLDGGVLLDSDTSGNDAKEKINNLYLKDLADGEGTKFKVLMIGQAMGVKQNETAIEDIFPPEFYLECVNDAYRTNIAIDDLPVDGSDQIVKRAEKALQKLGRTQQLSKNLVMSSMMKRFEAMEKVEHLPKGTATKAKKLFKKINEVFAEQDA